MIYTLEDGKKINIPDEKIKLYMTKLDLTNAEAIEMYLDEKGYQVNEEQERLNDYAEKMRTDVGIGRTIDAPKKEKTKRPTQRKVSDEKKEIFSTILKNLDRAAGVTRENITVLKENKLLQVKIGEKVFKIDIIEQRPPKK